MKISITLPSIHEDACVAAIENINATTRRDHEILVVSPFEAKGDNVIWTKEETRRGCNYAQCIASAKATGDLIVAHVDDFHYVKGWDDKVVPTFQILAHYYYPKFYLMGLRYDLGDDRVGTVFGIYYANFPMMRREELHSVGWLGSEYKVGFGDSDLSLRVWSKGGRVEFSPVKVLYPVPGPNGDTLDNARKRHNLFDPRDMELFLSTWKRKYGTGWDTSRLRGFNLDVDIEDDPQVVDGRTIYDNNPTFASSAKFFP